MTPTTALDQALGLVEQMRTWHTPYAGKPCQRCLVADGWSSCATATALAEIELRLRIAGATSLDTDQISRPAESAAWSDGSTPLVDCPRCGLSTLDGLHRNGFPDCYMDEVEVHP